MLTATSVEQVQAVVRICNEVQDPGLDHLDRTQLRLRLRCAGRARQIVLDLKKMNKILHIDPELCTALVEPGVTYQMLYDYIRGTSCR